MINIDTSIPLTAKQKLHLQRIVVIFLYYILHKSIRNEIINKIKGNRKHPFWQQYFLNYFYCNPNTIEIYNANIMILSVNNVASYLISPSSNSHVRGLYYLGKKDKSIINGSILYPVTIKRKSYPLPAEQKLKPFLYAHLAIQLLITLLKMGIQPSTLYLWTTGVSNITIKQTNTKTNKSCPK